ncbi:MAG: ABC transporter ATP-binding protein [Pseudoalteromonas prydzensis]|uniref:ABC transporter ATP-binding protein n=2 Tax=root TaxID=1 RepID=A0A7V1GDZ1_9GAMM|nr:ABC transporter ATP-binding protein [Pseudoalteromonas prydzensis]HEA15924.1 ABC transporter ATP-binding protein [Pseudoalteromonas prydzensis]
MSEFVINASKLEKQFGDLKAINQLDLAVEKGQIYGFLGPNGCGKTTAIRMLTGLLKPTSGTVEVLGLSLPTQANLLRERLGYMTQKFSLYADLTVYENLKFIAALFPLSKAEKRNRIDELLHTYGLDERASQLAGSMSGGQRQRLSLAAAVMNKPDILFLDEPTSAVDPQNRRDFWETLFDLSNAGTTILVTTHYMDEAERCHRLAILEAGVKRADGTPKQLMTEMHAHVVEIAGAQTRALKQQLATVSEVISATQLGAQLRVLVSKQVSDPLDFIKATSFAEKDWQLSLVRPSLEDVFVTCTGQGRQ